MEAIKVGRTEEEEVFYSSDLAIVWKQLMMHTVSVIGKPSRPAEDLDFTGVKFGVLPQYLAEEFKTTTCPLCRELAYAALRLATLCKKLLAYGALRLAPLHKKLAYAVLSPAGL
uniref:Uncharacterized protein n=1 Tax=Timema cristinae TaxID=61476 RepID=A0A7R9DGU0_TIMCR|nr:unnamed protein product [Timema cristinae]